MTLIGPGAHPRLHLTATWEIWETLTTADIFLGQNAGTSSVKPPR